MKPSVKLFPRIAPPPGLRKLAASTPHSRRRKRSTPVSDAVAARDLLRDELRTRLLDMILDNERARRDAQRPTAS